MRKRRETKLDAGKVLNPEKIRINLLLSSLYLSAFEILKIAIVERTRDFVVFAQEMTDEQAQQFKEALDQDVVSRIRKQYADQVEEYERQVGIKLGTPDQYALIPSCKWLQKMGALKETDVDEIKIIRDHRNEIAHELPSLLVGEGVEVNVELFHRIREYLRKIDVFWARSDLLFDLETLNEVNMEDVRDEDIVSMSDALLSIITDTVTDYLGQLGGGARPKAA